MVCEQLAERFAADGHDVVLLCAAVAGQPSREKRRWLHGHPPRQPVHRLSVGAAVAGPPSQITRGSHRFAKRHPVFHPSRGASHDAGRLAPAPRPSGAVRPVLLSVDGRRSAAGWSGSAVASSTGSGPSPRCRPRPARGPEISWVSVASSTSCPRAWVRPIAIEPRPGPAPTTSASCASAGWSATSGPTWSSRPFRLWSARSRTSSCTSSETAPSAAARVAGARARRRRPRDHPRFARRGGARSPCSARRG